MTQDALCGSPSAKVKESRATTEALQATLTSLARESYLRPGRRLLYEEQCPTIHHLKRNIYRACDPAMSPHYYESFTPQDEQRIIRCLAPCGVQNEAHREAAERLGWRSPACAQTDRAS